MKDLWVPLSGAIAQQRRVETIANNVANANTPGFKRDEIAFKEYLTALDKGHTDIDLPNKEWKPSDFYKTYGAEDSFVKTAGTYTDHGQGEMVPTGNPLDVGINGPGFIEVLTPNGVRFTRRGTLSLNSEGTLITEQGYPVLERIERSEDGASSSIPKERVIQISQGKIAISLEGDIFVNGVPNKAISVVEFKDVHSLMKEGNSLFINKHDTNFVTADLKTTLNQGFLEQSNVNAVKEMSNLIKASRNFESIQKVIKTYDDIAGKSVNQLLKF